MTAVPVHKGPLADRDHDWDWSSKETDYVQQILDDGGWKELAEAHAWYDDSDGDPPEKKGAYKLPHHLLIDGKLHVVWRGVSHAMNVVAGGRGGVKLPKKDIDGVYEHLAEHYRQFGEEPPER